MEGDLDELAERVFRGEKKPASSIQIIGSFETRKDLFEALLMLFTKGMKILYGNKEGHVDLINRDAIQNLVKEETGKKDRQGARSAKQRRTATGAVEDSSSG